MDTPLNIERVSLDDLHQDPANARTHGPENLDAIVASLKRFSQVEPLVVQASTGRVIGGNGRVEAMRKLGWTHCDVVRIDVDDLTARSLGLALNRTAELAAWDDKTLARLLQELQAEDALSGVGFDDADIDALLKDLESQAVPAEWEDPGAIDPPDQPVVRTSDLWLLGDHRLLCGDSTNADDVARLMNGETAVLLASDPPYLVDYDGTNHPAEHHKKAGRKKTKTGNEVGNKHWDDYVDPEASVEFFETWLRVALKHCIERVPVYQWHASRRQSLVEEAWERNGLFVHQTIVWVKPRGVLTRSFFLWRHEPAFFGWRKGKMPEKARRPKPDQTTIWEIGGESDGVHPTQKPVEVFARPIQYHTLRSEVVLEPFSGSGTQIIAAEQLGRRCYAMEQSPAFVEAALLRWEKATGKAAVLEETGETLAQVRQARSDAENTPAKSCGSDSEEDSP